MMEYFAKLKYAAVCALAALVLQGCDWVKGQMGMPTSGDIERMKVELLQKEEMEREEARKKALQDSLRNALPEVEAVGGYHVIIGSFKEYGNADALAEQMEKLGYKPQKIELKIGYMMVSLGGHATLQEAVAQMEKVGELDLCPYDVWVYGASQGLHK